MMHLVNKESLNRRIFNKKFIKGFNYKPKQRNVWKSEFKIDIW